MIKTKVAFWRAGFYLANQSNLKSIQKDLIGWKKPIWLAGKNRPSKKPLLFWSCIQVNTPLTNNLRKCRIYAVLSDLLCAEEQF